MSTSCNFVSFKEVVASVYSMDAKESCFTQEATKEHIEEALSKPKSARWVNAVCCDALDTGSLVEQAEEMGSTLLYLEGTDRIVYCAQ